MIWIMFVTVVSNVCKHQNIPDVDHQIQFSKHHKNELSQHNTMSWSTSEYTAWFISIPCHIKSIPSPLTINPRVSQRRSSTFIQSIYGYKLSMVAILSSVKLMPSASNSMLLMVFKLRFTSTISIWLNLEILEGWHVWIWFKSKPVDNVHIQNQNNF